VVIYDPTNGAPFPNDKLLSVNPIAQALLRYYPYPNLPGLTRNYQMATTSLSNRNSINGRIQQTLSTKNRITGTVAYQGSNSTTPNSLGFIDPTANRLIVGTGAGRGMNLGATWAHNFTTRLINNLAYTFSRNRNLSSPYFAGLQNLEAQLGILGATTDPLNWGPPSLNFTNYGGFSGGNASLTRPQTSSLTESMLWSRQKHTFTFGADFRRVQSNTETSPNARGSFNFNGYATSNIVNGVASPNTGFDLADFLLGVPDTASIKCGGAGAGATCNGSPAYYFRNSTFDVYFTDDWRLHPRFSVNLGIRWDYQTPVNEIHNQLVNLAVGSAFTQIAQVQPGMTDPFSGLIQSNTLMKPDKNNISPRLGIAWKPFAKKSTVIRSGYGVYYNTSVYSSIATQLSQQPPLARSLNLNVQNSPALIQTGQLNLGNAFTYGANTLTANTFAIDPNFKIGYAQTWNMSLQQNLPLSFQTTVTYTGTKGTNLDRQFQPWVQPPGANATPYPTGYTYETNGGNSIFNSGAIRLTRRFSSGLSASGVYTYSKSIDDGGTGAGLMAQNWLDFKSERALSSFDRRHSMNINFSYSTGQGRRGAGLMTGFKGALLKDWSLTSGITVQSGSPLTATCSGNTCTGVGSTNLNSRAEATGISLAPLVAGQFFNTAAFMAPLPGVWGNAGRDTIPGPIGVSVNGSAGRVFRFGERHSADLQLQARNVLNTVVISRWNTGVGSNTYGTATGVDGMRSVTATIRFRF
jgi:hypothetical protein